MLELRGYDPPLGVGRVFPRLSSPQSFFLPCVLSDASRYSPPVQHLAEETSVDRVYIVFKRKTQANLGSPCSSDPGLGRASSTLPSSQIHLQKARKNRLRRPTAVARDQRGVGGWVWCCEHMFHAEANIYGNILQHVRARGCGGRDALSTGLDVRRCFSWGQRYFGYRHRDMRGILRMTVLPSGFPTASIR